MNKLAQEYLAKHAGIQKSVIKTVRKIMKPEMAKKVIGGGLAGGISTLAIMPIDTISDTQKQWRNTRGEPELNRTSHSFLATAKELAHPKIREGAQGGPKPFYAGAGGKLLKVMPSMALTFAAEHKIRGLLPK